MYKKITFALTSSGRPDLLERTMDSFFKFNTYPIERYIISEDSAINNINDNLIGKYKDKDIEWIINGERLGQITTIDNMYSKIKTEYIFHCEEDWEFTDYSFIEKSLEILEKDKKILQVWLRSHGDTNGHPIEFFNEKYDLLTLDYLNIWSGFSFNPGLRRLCDYELIKPFKKIGHEGEISIKYRELGFRAAILKNKYVEHIGWGRHVKDII
jgi:hypothetical protein